MYKQGARERQVGSRSSANDPNACGQQPILANDANDTSSNQLMSSSSGAPESGQLLSFSQDNQHVANNSFGILDSNVDKFLESSVRANPVDGTSGTWSDISPSYLDAIYDSQRGSNDGGFQFEDEFLSTAAFS